MKFKEEGSFPIEQMLTELSVINAKEVLEKITHAKECKDKALDLSHLRLDGLPNELWELEQLEYLNLMENKIKTLPKEIANLKKLKRLIISDNKLTSLPSSIGELTNLNYLELFNNNIINLPNEIGKLKNLKLLNLSHNKLEELPEEITNLKSLATLYLDSNQLKYLPKSINRLKHLELLGLDHNNLEEVPNSIRELKSISILYLNDNQFSSFPNAITELSSLSALEIGNNKIKKIPKEIKKLKKLKSFDLSSNQIRELPEEIAYLKNLNKIHLSNKLLVSPPTLIAEKGINAIREYFKEIIATGVDYIYEAKLLVLGEPGAGKTSLTCKLKDSNADLPKESETTRGIDIEDWEIKLLKNKKVADIHIWDFGTQSIYKATHRFFLTQRSFYIVVVDARKEVADFNYWMHTIELFGEDSPVIIVINEMGNRKKKFNYNNLLNRFQNLKGKYEVNLDEIDSRFDFLVEELKYGIGNLPHIGDPVPIRWKKIREELKDLKEKKKVISKKEYKKICIKNNIKVKYRQEILCEFFHDLGVFLHFPNDDVLCQHIFLDNEWILDGVYSLIDNPEIIKKEGKFTRKEVEKYCLSEYEEFVPQLIAIMKKFYLVYEKEGFIITPQLLPYEQPYYKWNDQENIYFQFSYLDFMPFGIIWQLIIEMNMYIKEDLVWQNGLVISINNTVAEVIESVEDKEINIKVQGIEKDDVRAILFHKLDEINKKFKKLKAIKKVPCICEQCTSNNDPFLFDYEDAKKGANIKINPNQTIQCKKSFEMVSTDRLLKGYEFIESKRDNVLKDIQSTLHKIDNKIDNLSIELSQNLINEIAKNNEFIIDYEEMKKVINEQNIELAEALFIGITDHIDGLSEDLNNQLIDFKKQMKSTKKTKGFVDNKGVIKVGLPLAALTGLDIHYKGELNLNKTLNSIFKKKVV